MCPDYLVHFNPYHDALGRFDDAIEYGRAWMKDIGFNDMDADVINKFLGKY